MQSFESKVDGRSVAISMARISTAFFFVSGCFWMNFSLTRTAAALPSEVGLEDRNVRYFDREKMYALPAL